MLHVAGECVVNPNVDCMLHVAGECTEGHHTYRVNSNADCMLHVAGECVVNPNVDCMLQVNALKAITPATLDILLHVLSASQRAGPTNEQRLDSMCLKELVLKCVVKMVHVIHGCSPDQVRS